MVASQLLANWWAGAGQTKSGRARGHGQRNELWLWGRLVAAAASLATTARGLAAALPAGAALAAATRSRRHFHRLEFERLTLHLFPRLPLLAGEDGEDASLEFLASLVHLAGVRRLAGATLSATLRRSTGTTLSATTRRVALAASLRRSALSARAAAHRRAILLKDFADRLNLLLAEADALGNIGPDESGSTDKLKVKLAPASILVVVENLLDLVVELLAAGLTARTTLRRATRATRATLSTLRRATLAALSAARESALSGVTADARTTLATARSFTRSTLTAPSTRSAGGRNDLAQALNLVLGQLEFLLDVAAEEESGATHRSHSHAAAGSAAGATEAALRSSLLGICDARQERSSHDRGEGQDRKCRGFEVFHLQSPDLV